MVAAISQELEEFVRSEVANGHFATREEVIATALKQMRDRQAAFDQRVRDAIAEADATPGEDIVLETHEDFLTYAESIKTRGLERLAQKRNQP